MREEPWTIGVDVGGTKTVVARVNEQGVVEERIRFSTDVKGGPDAVISAIVTAAKDLEKKAGTRPAAMGVGVAGQTNEKNGVVLFAPNLVWREVPMGPSLSNALQLPVLVTNDVRAATWGEWLHGSGRDVNDLVCIFVGTGIGGGIVSNGKMVSGCSNTAGEIGHMTIDLHGPRCHCRNSGCFEALAGGWAIARNAQEAIKRDPGAGTAMLDLADGVLAAVTARIVGEAAYAGDPLARRLMDDVVLALSAGAVALVNAFNPCRLIFGGGVMEGMPELLDRVKEGVLSSALLTAIDRLQIVPARLREDAGVIGMAAYALRTAADKERRRSAA